MTAFMGRSIGIWGTLTVLAGAAVMVPSMIALALALIAAASALL